MRDDIFRLRALTGRDERIDEWLFHQPDALRAIARRLIDVIREAAPDSGETLHDGFPAWCIDGAAFAYVAAFRAHVNLGFFHGADLPDPERRLTGAGKRMRHVKLRSPADIETAGAEKLIRAAADDMRRRVAGPGEE